MNSKKNTKYSPKLSIGMPVYNGALYIKQAIGSILSQSFRDFELIISDNASIDETEKICRSYAVKDTRIIYIRQEVNKGAQFNFTFVLKKAQGEFFMWAAHDDERLAFHIDKLMSIHRNGEYILVASQCTMFDDHGDPIIFKKIADGYLNASRWRSFRNYLVLHHSAYAKANLVYGIFLREQLLTIPIFSEGSSAIGSDHILLLKTITKGRIHFIPEVTWIRHVKSPKKLKREDFNGNYIEFTKERVKYKLKIIKEIIDYTGIVKRIIIENWRGVKQLLLLLLNYINLFRIVYLHLKFNPFRKIKSMLSIK